MRVGGRDEEHTEGQGPARARHIPECAPLLVLAWKVGQLSEMGVKGRDPLWLKGPWPSVLPFHSSVVSPLGHGFDPLGHLRGIAV